MMDVIFGHLLFCAAYVDDILSYSDNHQDHVTHLRQVLHLLQENGLVVRPDKNNNNKIMLYTVLRPSNSSDTTSTPSVFYPAK